MSGHVLVSFILRLTTDLRGHLLGMSYVQQWTWAEYDDD